MHLDEYPCRLHEAIGPGGQTVYCEKPIGLDYQEAVDAVGVVRAANVPVMLGFNRRFDPKHAALCEEVRRGDVGNLEIIQMTSRGPNLSGD